MKSGAASQRFGRPAAGSRFPAGGSSLICCRGTCTFVFLLLALLAGSGCAHRRIAARRPSPPPTIPPSKAELAPLIPGHYVEEGTASWYGIPFQGHRTSNGEIYDMYQFTAAHRTLPFDSLVRVTNLRTGKKIEVRINDRGPFVADRIIDLSLAAARALDMVGTGTAPVRLELVSGPNPAEGFFAVQVGAFQLQKKAEMLREHLAARYAPVTIQTYDSPKGLFYRVRVGQVRNQNAAWQLARQLQGDDRLETFVVRLDH